MSRQKFEASELGVSETSEGRIESPTLTDEGLHKYDEYFKQVFHTLFDSEELPPSEHRAFWIEPSDVNYDVVAQGNFARFGSYTLNPELNGRDFEGVNALVIDALADSQLRAMDGQPMYEVLRHLIRRWGDAYELPGLEFMQWLTRPDVDPPRMAFFSSSENICYFPGTLMGGSNETYVPSCRWNNKAKKWSYGKTTLRAPWRIGTQFILIPKQ